MFYQAILIGIFFIILSCGQDNQPTIEEANGRNAVTENTTTKDTNAMLVNTAGEVKHDEYNENINDLPKSIAQFVPEGYTVLDTTLGNLNLDPYADLIMVLKKNGEEATSEVVNHPEKRPLLILKGQVDNTFKLAARNDNSVYCIDCGGMMGAPFIRFLNYRIRET